MLYLAIYNIKPMDHPTDKMIVAAAGQNLDTKKERVIHRFVPLLVAENLTRITEYHTGKPIQRVDLWNCIGMRMDKSFSTQQDYPSRRDFSTALLNDKYYILEQLGISKEGREVIRDDDPDTQEWLTKKIEQLLSYHAIYTDLVDVNVCDNCGYLQAIGDSPIGSCTICSEKSYHIEKREVLMVDIPQDRDSLIQSKVLLPKNTNHVQSFFHQLPPRTIISKVREYGLPLDSIGLPGYVLDPKIGVALIPQLLAERYNLTEVTQVQGAAIATNAIPYTSILTSGFYNTYVLLPKIPITSLEDAKNIGMSFINRYLPLILMTHKGDITDDQYKTIQEEYARITQKIDNILFLLQSNHSSVTNLTQEDHDMLREIVRDFSEYNIREGQSKLWLFFKKQGRRYAEEMQSSGYYLSPTDIETLERIVRLFYR